MTQGKVAVTHPEQRGDPPRVVAANPGKPPRRRRGRRRNPRWKPDGAAAAGLGVIGAAVGLISTITAGAVRRTWTKLLVGTAAGAATGAILGASLPKGRAKNPRRPLENPIGIATAIGAGMVLALVPVAVVAQRRPMATNRTMPPTVRGKFGTHAVDVFRNGSTWGWRAPSLDMAGAGDSRRDAIINAYSEIVISSLQPDDRIVLDFYPEQFQVQILADPGQALWSWGASSTGEGGDSDSRGTALQQALDWVDDHSQLS